MLITKAIITNWRPIYKFPNEYFSITNGMKKNKQTKKPRRPKTLQKQVLNILEISPFKHLIIQFYLYQ